jgi:hypothetical protein
MSMKKVPFLLVFLIFAPTAFADAVSCNVDGKALFNLIDLDTVSKVAVLTDSFGNETRGKITLIRDAGNGKSKFNISLEYELNNTPAYLDLILAPVSDQEYSVGMAAYVLKGRKKLLEIASKDKAICF